jgi:hypothetical protein
MTLDPTPPPSTQLHHAKAFARVGENVRTIHALAPYIHTTPSVETIATLHHFHPLVEVDLPLLLMILIQRWILFWIERHLFMFWCIHHIFHSTVLRIWCMNFCDIVLSMITLLVPLIFVFKYACTLLVVKFLHQYHACLLQHDYWF